MQKKFAIGVILGYTAAGLVYAQSAGKPDPVKATEATPVQYDGQSPYQIFDRPSKNQGLDALLSRGRVQPEELLLEKAKKGAQPTFSSARTIFHDQYTGAEVWRITDFPSGITSHTYSGVPAWNANGRYIELGRAYHAEWLFDQENCTLASNFHGGEWSPTEPNILYSAGQWEKQGAVIAFDIVQNKALRALGPIRPKSFAGVAPISPDGKYACWREGTQDDATTFGVAATDGSSYKSIKTTGGILAEHTAANLFDPLPDPPSKSEAPGIHQMYFTRRPDHSVEVNVMGNTPPHGRIIGTDGKMLFGFENLTHQSWQPHGDYVFFMKQGNVAMDPETKKEWTILNMANAIEGHTTWNSFDPDWAAMSLRAKFGGDIVRMSMRDDHSVPYLCGSCPLNANSAAYLNNEFACMSPDGTKILFMSNMSGSVCEYIVVAANPRAPKISGQWKDQKYELTITPDPLSREIKGYEVYRTDKTGQDYSPVAFVTVPEWAPVGTQTPLTYDMTDLPKGQNLYFAVQAQEWSGLRSRYSNEVSTENKPTATYIEPYTLAFTGFMQAFDPKAGDLYYLFVPKEGQKCSVTFENPPKDAQVWVRVGGPGWNFTANGTTFAIAPSSVYGDRPDWNWVNLGNISGTIKIESKCAGFKFDRIFITPDKTQVPEGKGLDYHPSASFAVVTPQDVQAKSAGPFAAEITWKHLGNARYYNVYAGDNADFAPAQANLLYSPPGDAERAVDWGLKPATSYYYKVVAFDYDGTASKPSAAVQIKTDPLVVQTVSLDFASAPDAKVEDDAAASANGKAVLLEKGKSLQLKFTIPADGDYVIWHDFHPDVHGSGGRLQVSLDDQHYMVQDMYDLTSLRGGANRTDWAWSRFTFLWTKDENAILHLKAGQHTIGLSCDSPIHLDRLIITNDQSFVPVGRLCTF